MVSFLAFANYVREFRPEYPEQSRHLRPLTKKGAKFELYSSNPQCAKVFLSIRETLAIDAELHCPDWATATDKMSSLPFARYVDASDTVKSDALAQRWKTDESPQTLQEVDPG